MVVPLTIYDTNVTALTTLQGDGRPAGVSSSAGDGTAFTIFEGDQPVNVSMPGLIPFTDLQCRFQYEFDAPAWGWNESMYRTAVAFNSSRGNDRWYGTALVPGTYGADHVMCVTPSAEAAGVVRRLTWRFGTGFGPDGPMEACEASQGALCPDLTTNTTSFSKASIARDARRVRRVWSLDPDAPPAFADNRRDEGPLFGDARITKGCSSSRSRAAHAGRVGAHAGGAAAGGASSCARCTLAAAATGAPGMRRLGGCAAVTASRCCMLTFPATASAPSAAAAAFGSFHTGSAFRGVYNGTQELSQQVIQILYDNNSSPSRRSPTGRSTGPTCASATEPPTRLTA